MAFKKSTLRREYPTTKLPTTRKVARLQGEMQSISRRLKNLLPKIKECEFESLALETAKQETVKTIDLDKIIEAMPEANRLQLEGKLMEMRVGEIFSKTSDDYKKPIFPKEQ